MQLALWFLLVTGRIAVAVSPLKCGFANDMMQACPRCLETAINTDALDFWWNWKTSPEVNLHGFPETIVEKADSSFVPMVWGQSAPIEGYGFLDTSSYVMGFNEPDMYGPACFGDWNPPPIGCPKGETRKATSAGWAPLFDPNSASNFWQNIVQDMSRYPRSNNRPAPRILSPSMAGKAAGTQSCIGVDPSLPGTIKICNGWLQEFKRFTLEKQCTDLAGQVTNCWDVIDHIQIHGYALTADSILLKIQEYYEAFQEDFEGLNGRKKKTLWLTEVAMGSNNLTEIVQFVEDLMNLETGLASRDKFPYLEKVSWFSSYDFPAFSMDDYDPPPLVAWTSSLFHPFGSLSPVGERFFDICKKAADASGTRRLADKAVHV